MKDFRHYIFTRFNWGWLDNLNRDRHGQPVNTQEWLKHRCELFEKYCLPSIVNQTCQDFTWLVKFDPRTPEELIAKYKRYCTPVFEKFPDYVKKQNNPKWIITTRLDNDDFYHIDYIKIIQSMFNKKTLLIDAKGYKFKNGKFYVGKQVAGSSFLSLMEPFKNCQTVVKYEHREMIRHFRTIKLNQFLWAQTIHPRTMKNRVGRASVVAQNVTGFVV